MADLETSTDRVHEVFVGKDILLTGASGFLGKVFLEKLLRTCYDVNKIYLLVRAKKGKEPKQRLDEIYGNPLFDGVREMHGGNAGLIAKTKLIAGDVSVPGLGLSEEDRKFICENVNFIYHGAATIRFDEELKKAVLLNTRGTKLMLELARECKKLSLFCHISTSYCHLNEKLLLEKAYPPPADPHKVIQCVEWLDEGLVNTMTDKILGTYPNTYAFTKALSEHLVAEAVRDNVPCIIIRPSIVIPIWQGPIPGWTDNINGPTGLLIGAGKGVIRTMYCHSDGYADYVPVDIVANTLMVCTWNYVYNKDTEKMIYNITSSAEVRISWQEMIDIGRNIVTNKIPLNGVAWYPGGSMKNSRLHHNICVFFFHLLPAMFVDTLLFVIGYKPVLMRVQRRINKGFEVFEYYANNQWDFKSDNIQYIRGILNPVETGNYKIDSIGLDIPDYFEKCILATRKFILKESEESLPAARRHMNVMYYVDLITRIAFWGMVFWFFSDYIFMLYNYIFKSDGRATLQDASSALPLKKV